MRHQNRRAREGPFAQPLQDGVGLSEWMRFHFDLEWDTTCQLHEFLAIPTGKIGDRSNDPLTPQDLVGHGRDLAHVYPSENERAALHNLPEGDRNQIPYWRKDDRSVGWFGRSFIRAASPFTSQRTGEISSLDIVGTREGEDAPALMPG